MKICFDARPATQPGGIGRFSQELISHLLKIDRRNHYNILVWEEQNFLPKTGNSQVVKLNQTNKRNLPFFWEHLYLPRLREVESVDIYHSPHVTAPLFLRSPLLLTAHDLSIYNHPEWFPRGQFFSKRIVIPVSVKKAKRIIAVSEIVKQELLINFKIPEEKISVIPGGVNQTFIDSVSLQNVNKNKDSPYILFVGVVAPYKNLTTLAKSFAYIDKKINLVIAGFFGKGSERSKQEINKLGSRVKILGFIKDDQELTRLYKNALCLVAPSLHESFGLPVYEALAVGTPVVASDIPAFRHLEGNRLVTLFNSMDYKDLAEKVNFVISNRRSQAQIKAISKEIAKNYDWEAVAKQTLKVYKLL